VELITYPANVLIEDVYAQASAAKIDIEALHIHLLQQPIAS
jgi:hypothetical protein